MLLAVVVLVVVVSFGLRPRLRSDEPGSEPGELGGESFMVVVVLATSVLAGKDVEPG